MAGDGVRTELRVCWCGCGALAISRQVIVMGEVVWVQRVGDGAGHQQRGRVTA